VKIDFDRVYQERIEEIDKQITIAICRKHWGIKSSLEIEKKKLLRVLSTMEG